MTMTSTKGMKQSGFKRPVYQRPPVSHPQPISRGVVSRCDALALVQPKTVEQRNPHLLSMARGKPCLLRVPGVCNNDWRTTVAAHSNWTEHGKSGARKADDIFHVHSCSACHTWLDQGPAPKAEKKTTFMRAHLDQVLAWRRIVGDMSYTPKDRAAAHWALCLLEATPTGETP